jgi:hypothetical protein
MVGGLASPKIEVQPCQNGYYSDCKRNTSQRSTGKSDRSVALTPPAISAGFSASSLKTAHTDHHNNSRIWNAQVRPTFCNGQRSLYSEKAMLARTVWYSHRPRAKSQPILFQRRIASMVLEIETGRDEHSYIQHLA